MDRSKGLPALLNSDGLHSLLTKALLLRPTLIASKPLMAPHEFDTDI